MISRRRTASYRAIIFGDSVHFTKRCYNSPDRRALFCCEWENFTTWLRKKKKRQVFVVTHVLQRVEGAEETEDPNFEIL